MLSYLLFQFHKHFAAYGVGWGARMGWFIVDSCEKRDST